MDKQQLIDMPVEQQLIEIPIEQQFTDTAIEQQLIDMPIEKGSFESLGVKMYADVLANFIKACETPITIGIQGDWGIGKTSLLYMITENLGPKQGRTEKYRVIYFNTWQYSQFNQEEFLGLSILRGIMTSVKKLESLKENNNGELKDSVVKLGKFVANLGDQMLKGKYHINVKKAQDESPADEIAFFENDVVTCLSEMKDEFSHLVKSLIKGTNDKLVILIDDLDRIKPIKALEFLEAVKNFLDVEGCVFVIAVDYSVIQTGMIEKLGRSAQELKGKSYFDKIIQVPFNMPTNSYITERYVMSLLGWRWDKEEGKYQKQKPKDPKKEYFLRIKDEELKSEHAEFFDNITQLTVGNNPRGIKRTINYANLLKMIVEVKRKGSHAKWTLENAKVLYSLACFQLAWPELFSHFAENPSPKTIQLYQDFDFLSQINGIDALFKRAHNPDELKSQISGFFDEFLCLVDTDGNGKINDTEFKPIWNMMGDANLRNPRLLNFEENLNKIMEMAKNHCEQNDLPMLEKAFKLFSESKWKDPNHLKLLEAGKKFFNILWDKKQVGSLVSTKKEPIQLYLKTEANGLKSALSEDVSKYIDDVGVHWGIGDTKINLYAMSESANGIEMMNEIHEKFFRQPKAGMAQLQDISRQT